MRDERPDINLIPLEQPAAAQDSPPLGATANLDAAATRGELRRRTPKRPAEDRTDWWPWLAGLAVVMAAVAAVIVFDRRDRANEAQTVPTTAPMATTMPTGTRAPVTEGVIPVPAGLAGTLYALGEDESLLEIDLPTGRTRQALLRFDVAPWFVNQVISLREVVLVATRRDVFSVDRSTLTQQQRIAEQRWIVASPDGSWAALVPFGDTSSEITIIDGTGAVLGGPALRLPSGVSVQGAVTDGLIVDAAGVLAVLRLDGSAGSTIGAGKYLASGPNAVARLVCGASRCQTYAGTVAQPDLVQIDGLELAGPWYFGPGAVFDPAGERLASVAPRARGSSDAVARVTDLSAAAASGAAGPNADSPLAVPSPGALPPLAFTSDGGTLVHTSPAGIGLWRFSGETGAAAPNVAEVAVDSELLAVTVTPQPPPPPPQSSGPPPSFA